MGSFSIFHVLVLLAFLLSPILGVFLASGTKRLARLPFALRWGGYILFGMIAPYVALAAIPLMIVAFIGIFVMNILLCLWSVHRLNDAGHSRYWALLLIVPPISLIFMIVLCFLPSQAVDNEIADQARDDEAIEQAGSGSSSPSSPGLTG